MTVSVILPTHNPDPGRLARTVAGLRAQSLPLDQWELVLVDNASRSPVPPPDLPNARAVAEPMPGLTHARRRGLHASHAGLVVFVDDDNVLAPDYLDQLVRIFTAHPQLGALGGKNLPEFEVPPPDWWQPEFDELLACRDLGDQSLLATDRREQKTGCRIYPDFAPVGAGMALRRAAVQAWLEDPAASSLPDRRSTDLSSGGDNDIVLSILRAGWEIGYFPQLRLTHLIPVGRLERAYLARLKRGIARSWVRVLHRHDANPWPPVSVWSVPLRQLKAWFAYRAWVGPAEYIHWQGACGHFEGLADLGKKR